MAGVVDPSKFLKTLFAWTAWMTTALTVAKVVPANVMIAKMDIHSILKTLVAVVTESKGHLPNVYNAK